MASNKREPKIGLALERFLLLASERAGDSWSLQQIAAQLKTGTATSQS